MKHRILKDFFYGNLAPSERQFEQRSEYGSTVQGLSDTEEKLRALLDGESRDLLKELVSLQTTLCSLTAEGYFIEGMRTGFQMALALTDEDAPGFFKRMVDNND